MGVIGELIVLTLCFRWKGYHNIQRPSLAGDPAVQVTIVGVY